LPVVANADTTFFFSPQKGDQVIVGFVAGDVNEPIVLGYAHSTKGRPPSTVSAPSVHGVVSKIGRVTFDEQAGKIEVVFNGLLPLQASSMTMDATGVTIHSDTQIFLEAPQGAINLVSPLVTVASSGFAVSGTPTFLPANAPLPGLGDDVPSVAEMTFPGGLKIKSDAEVCVNEHGVVLEPFVTKIFGQHVHATAGLGPPSPPALLPVSGPPELIDPTSLGDEFLTRCLG
jgi:phage baseplate assembly protein gpV